MQDSPKYLIHADIRTSGVVERSDVVGAIFGQTEGLLGDELDLRDLQESSKVGRIDVEITAEAGRSYGTVSIASGLDKAETAVLAAALETIDRVGPCRAEFEVTELEDARAAKRREVVARATQLLTDFEASALSSQELVEAVRENVRVEDITEYEGLPAGPRVAESDAIIVVEGRADVLRLLRYGIKNAVAVEGTDVPDGVADLTNDRTVTAFLDGDRGGELILEELAQVGDVDYVAFAPSGRSVEELSRNEVLAALRQKLAYERVEDAESPRGRLADATSETGGTRSEDVDGDDGSDTDSSGTDDRRDDSARETATEPAVTNGAATSDSPDDEATTDRGTDASDEPPASATDDRDEESSDGDGTSDEDSSRPGTPETLAGHVDAIIAGDTGRVRVLGRDCGVLAEAPAADAFDAVDGIGADGPDPTAVVLDGEVTQRLLDVAAQRGVEQIVASGEGEFVKQPTAVRVRIVADA